MRRVNRVGEPQGKRAAQRIGSWRDHICKVLGQEVYTHIPRHPQERHRFRDSSIYNLMTEDPEFIPGIYILLTEDPEIIPGIYFLMTEGSQIIPDR